MQLKKAVAICILSIATAFLYSQNTAKEYYTKAKQADSIGEYTLAIELLKKSLEADQFFDSAIYLQSAIHYKQKNWQEVIQQLNNLIDFRPEYKDAYYVRGIAKGEQQDYVGAVKDFNKALKSDENNSKIYYNLALAKAHLTDYSAAIADLDKAITLQPDYTEAYYSRAYWKNISGDLKGAISDYAKTIQLNTEYSEAYIALGTLLYQQGEKEKACKLMSALAKRGSYMAEELISKFCNR